MGSFRGSICRVSFAPIFAQEEYSTLFCLWVPPLLSEETPAPHDHLLSYKKPQLGERFRALQQLVGDLQQQLAVTVDGGMKRASRNSMPRWLSRSPTVRSSSNGTAQMHREEQGPFSGFPGGIDICVSHSILWLFSHYYLDRE
jgi:hypothetical protein